MDACEFNLRAHQKVLNAVVADMIRMAEHINADATVEEDKFKFQYVPLVDMTQDVQGETQVVTRVDWGKTHQMVEADLKEIRDIEEAEKKRKEEEIAAAEAKKAEETEKEVDEELGAVGESIEKAVADHADALKEGGNDPAEVEAEAKKVTLATKKVAEEAAKMARGEPYDEKVIADAQRAIEEDEAKYPEGATIFGG
jgi:hypothetical protein